MEFVDGDKSQEKDYSQLKKIYRELLKDFKEYGEYDLYIGFPFVVGKLPEENFTIRAPLVLFPIQAIKEVNKIVLTINKNKDVLFNNNLVLASYKFNNIEQDLPDNVLSDYNINNFFDKIVSFYDENGIKFNNIGHAMNLPFKEFEYIKQSEFPRYERGNYDLALNALIGRFSLCSTAIQKDFRKIVASPKLNPLVNELLENIDDTNLYADSNDVTAVQGPISERNINYINDLNSSQENAIMEIYNVPSMVIQGPPGTGKSQTIVSMIADLVAKDKNVLMVSQKKAALEVIYSRLGLLQGDTLFLTDTKDKNSFYSQLQSMFTKNSSVPYSADTFNRCSKFVDDKVAKFISVGNSIYYKKTHGVEVCKLYQENCDNYFTTSSSEEILNWFQLVGEKLLNIDYYALKDIKAKFEDLTLTDKCVKNCQLSTKYPYLLEIKKLISIKSQSDFIHDVNAFVTSQEDCKGGGFFRNLLTYGKRKKMLSEIYEKYFDTCKTQNFVFKNYELLKDGCANVENYFITKSFYMELTELEKLFIQTISKIQISFNLSLHDCVERLFDFIVFNDIKNFEANGQDVLTTIDNFEKDVNNISERMSEKKEQTKIKIHDLLKQSFKEYILASKRASEIQRVCESKRKWSVNKFLQKFNFELFKGIKIWLMTPDVVSEILPLEMNMFDVVIFDEASQMYIENGIPSITRAKKVVIAGDHKQLRPSSLGFGRIDADSEENEDELEDVAALEEESLLDLARFKFPSVMLNYHYRSKYEELISFSNYTFYKGNLNVSPNVECSITPPIEFLLVENATWENRQNIVEAKRVVKLVKDLMLSNSQNKTSGVITFNIGQRECIQDLLDKECQKDSNFASVYNRECSRTKNGEDISFFIKNIENVQGDERDIIIFSLAYARNEKGVIVRNFGWLNQQNGENRLNVAITRSKEKIYIVSSLKPEELLVDDLKNDGPKIFRKYLDYAYAISKGNSQMAKSVLNSISKSDSIISTMQNKIIDEISEYLSNFDLQFEKNFGLAQYKIDLAIKDKNGERFILGVDIDDKLYRIKSSRERDIYRDKYLNIRGWKMLRVWSSDWWKDKQKVLDKIIFTIKDLNK